MKVRHRVMINSESSELEQIEQGNIPPNTHFSEEEHVQMFSGTCPRHITKAMLSTALRRFPDAFFGQFRFFYIKSKVKSKEDISFHMQFNGISLKER